MAGRRRTWLLAAAVVLVLLGAFVVFYFEPQKLFIDERVSEALPSAAAAATPAPTASPTASPDPAGTTASPAPAGPIDIATGTFISREHETIGTARVIEYPDGQQILRLEGFETSNGPALYVYLSPNPAEGEDGAFEDGALDLGALKGNIGDQNYPVPAGVDPTGYASVVIWCDRFSVSFGAADLAPAAA